MRGAMWWKQVWVMMVMAVVVMARNAGALSLACQSGLVTLVPCMAYLQGDGSGSPSVRCCGSLSSLLSSQPTCFCELLDQAGGGGNDNGINSTTALQAFSACAISLPSDIQACIAATSGGTPPGSPPPPAPARTPAKAAPPPAANATPTSTAPTASTTAQAPSSTSSPSSSSSSSSSLSSSSSSSQSSSSSSSSSNQKAGGGSRGSSSPPRPTVVPCILLIPMAFLLLF